MEQSLLNNIKDAYEVLKQQFLPVPLQRNDYLSEYYNCNVYLKREDLQVVRSFKIRGAYCFIRSLGAERDKGVVCASAGNHAQGVAYSCKEMGIQGTIFMPVTTPGQKVSQVKRFGGAFVEVVLTGDTFDDAAKEANLYCELHGKTFIHPFDDYRTIAGQGTVAVEIEQQLAELNIQADYLFATIGGGGLLSGVGTYFRDTSPATRLVGVEPAGAAGMKHSFDHGEVTALDTIDKFVDGAAVKQVGKLTYDICRAVLDDIVVVPDGKECTAILDLYNYNAIVAEPAGALPIAALDSYRDRIYGTNVVCIVSGGNNDIDRMQVIKERSLIYEGLKHYFIINFPQRPGALRDFLDKALGPNDDIVQFEYMKKTNREHGPALVGIELADKADYESLFQRLTERYPGFIEVNRDTKLFNYLV